MDESLRCRSMRRGQDMYALHNLLLDDICTLKGDEDYPIDELGSALLHLVD